MNIKELSSVACKFLSEYFINIQRAVEMNQITPRPSMPFLYPSTLLAIESDEHFILEIVGSRPARKKDLLVCKRRIKSTESYFDQFNGGTENPVLTINTAHLNMKGIVLCRVDENKKLTSRFPVLEGFGSKYRIHKPEGNGSLILFGSDVKACVLKGCFFVNASNGVYRLKMMNFGIVLSKQTTSDSLINILQREFPAESIRGISEPKDSLVEALQISGQLQSLYLSPAVHETTIGAFLSAHPEIMKAALGSSAHIYEPYLDWVHKPPHVDENAINPDMFVRRNDGFWDIVDFKTAALRRKQLTKGRHQRRRFIDYVYEGIAQLVNYAEYFENEENQHFAKEKYGICVKSPKLYLIVGSQENCDMGVLAEALRAHKEVSIVDYDTLIQAYLRAMKQTAITNKQDTQPKEAFSIAIKQPGLQM